MTKTDVCHQLVCDLVSAQQNRDLIDQQQLYPDLKSDDDAYRIQDQVAAELGELPVKAWKLGASSPESEPYCAPIYASRTYQSPAQIASNQFHGMGMEAELCFVFAKPLPARPEPYQLQEVLAAIGQIEVAIELVDSRLAEWRQRDRPLKLADNQMNGALIIGNGIAADFSQLQPDELIGQLWVNDFLVAAGPHVIQQPLAALSWLANHLVSRQGGLQQGDRVITGSWTGMTFVFAGDYVRACFPGIGEAKVLLL